MPEALLGKHETQFFSPLPKWVKLQHFKSIFVTGVFIPQDNFQGTFLHSSISLQFFLVRLLCHTAKDCSNLLLTCNIWIFLRSCTLFVNIFALQARKKPQRKTYNKGTSKEDKKLRLQLWGSTKSHRSPLLRETPTTTPTRFFFVLKLRFQDWVKKQSFTHFSADFFTSPLN